MHPTPGRITRVRMEAEAGELETVQVTLNAAFGVIWGAALRSAETGIEGPFSRETEFGEEVYESKVRDDGAIYYVGRRVVSFVEPANDWGIFEPRTADAEIEVVPPQEAKDGEGLTVKVLIGGKLVDVWASPDVKAWRAAQIAAEQIGYRRDALVGSRLLDGDGNVLEHELAGAVRQPLVVTRQ